MCSLLSAPHPPGRFGEPPHGVIAAVLHRDVLQNQRVVARRSLARSRTADVWHSPPKNLAVRMHRMTGLQAIYLCAGRHLRKFMLASRRYGGTYSPGLCRCGIPAASRLYCVQIRFLHGHHRYPAIHGAWREHRRSRPLHIHPVRRLTICADCRW